MPLGTLTGTVNSRDPRHARYSVPPLNLSIYLFIAPVLDRRRRRQREAAANNHRECGDRRVSRHINSVSHIDRVARIVFPASFGLLNVCYWVVYVTYQEEFKWQDPPIGSITPIPR